MSLIVAARFDTFPSAENAARRLFADGIAEEDVSIFFVNPAGQHGTYPLGGDEASDSGARGAHVGAALGAGLIGVAGAALGALIWAYAGVSPLALIITVGVGAYIGSLGGALLATKSAGLPRARGQSTGIRKAGVLASVHVTRENEALVARLLKDCGGMDVEKAAGRWRDGNWIDFDPVAPPVLSDKVEPKAARSPSQTA